MDLINHPSGEADCIYEVIVKWRSTRLWKISIQVKMISQVDFCLFFNSFLSCLQFGAWQLAHVCSINVLLTWLLTYFLPPFSSYNPPLNLIINPLPHILCSVDVVCSGSLWPTLILIQSKLAPNAYKVGHMEKKPLNDCRLFFIFRLRFLWRGVTTVLF